MHINTYAEMASSREVAILISKECPYSPKAIELLKDITKKNRDVIWRTVEATSVEGRQIIRRFGIDAVPAFIINGKLGYVGLPTKQELEVKIKDR
ncbi:MAG: thioredoxin family protein [Candidatus Nanoarchaeia archaeon]|nr:thioredoxin family protein [Candidatus Nanoarchaeia archaeon]